MTPSRPPPWLLASGLVALCACSQPTTPPAPAATSSPVPPSSTAPPAGNAQSTELEPLPSPVPGSPLPSREPPSYWVAPGDHGGLVDGQVWMARRAPVTSIDGWNIDACFYSLWASGSRRRTWSGPHIELCPESPWIQAGHGALLQLQHGLALLEREGSYMSHRWRTAGSERRPLLMGGAILTWRPDVLSSLSVASGEPIWSLPWASPQWWLHDDGQLLIGTLTADGTQQEVVHLDSSYGTVQTRYTLESAYPSAARSGDTLLLANQDELRFLELPGGQSHTGGTVATEAQPPELLGDEHGFVVGGDHHLSAWTPDGQHRWTLPLPLSSSPSLVATEQFVFAFNRATTPREDGGPASRSRPAPRSGATPETPRVYAVDRSSGQLHWQLEAPPIRALEVHEDTLMIVHDMGAWVLSLKEEG